jgi:hypothetical protein
VGHSKGSAKEKVLAMDAYIKNTEKPQISSLMLHLKLLEKQKQAKPKTSRRREIIKARAKIRGQNPNKNTNKRINETKSYF